MTIKPYLSFEDLFFLLYNASLVADHQHK